MRSFRDMFNEVLEYQRKLGYDFESMSYEERMTCLRDYTVALSMEQAEVLDEVSWKPWRTIESQKPIPNKRKIALELVDCLVFLFDQCYCLEMSADDILSAFETKLKANNQRILSGYSKVRHTGKNVNTEKTL